MRRAFLSLFGTPRRIIHPSADLTKLLPWTTRRTRWRNLQEHLDLTLPALVYTTWLVFLSLAAAIALGIFVLTPSRQFGGRAIGLIEVIAGSFGAWLCLILLLIPLARGFPRSCDTFGDLVRLTLARNYATFATQYGAVSDNQILTLLTHLIAAETNIDIKEVTPETRIPQGLNIE